MNTLGLGAFKGNIWAGETKTITSCVAQVEFISKGLSLVSR
ncbi:MAG: hypothetical protein ABJB85_10975 [Nitrososphaerota archaeon]